MALQTCLQPAAGLGLPRAQRAQRRQRSLLVCAGQTYKIAVLPGDGIGPEITKVALRALEAAGRKADVSFSFKEALIGGAAIDATGKPLPDETLQQCKDSDAVLLAAIGGWACTCAPKAAMERMNRCSCILNFRGIAAVETRHGNDTVQRRDINRGVCSSGAMTW
jgi:Isocitrate/isopropylmalate dehydrogenase